MKTKQQLIAELQELEKTLQSDIKEIETLADKKGVYVHIDYSQAFGKKCLEVYPLLNLSRGNVFRGNGFDSTANTILDALYNPEDNFLRLIGFQEINKKAKTFKMNREYRYYLHYLSYFGFPENIKEQIETIKEFQNGSSIMKFKNDKDFEKFEKIVDFTNLETETILKNITPEIKREYQETLKKESKAFNEYYPIHKLAEKFEIPSRPLNYRLIKEALLS